MKTAPVARTYRRRISQAMMTRSVLSALVGLDRIFSFVGGIIDDI
jgi:hypothetical protein